MQALSAMVKVRVDGTAVAVVRTEKISLKGVCLPVDELPLTKDSFVELEFFDGVERIIVPARVSVVGETELTLEYEQTSEAFKHWYALQLDRQLLSP